MDDNQDQGGDVPGGVYLCQINELVSCGACCGLYNFPDLSYETLLNSLRKRTFEFAKTPREVSAILCFGEKSHRQIQNNSPFPEFHHCPYVGLIGSELSRIGCLLHPLADGNKNVDFRGLSYYGGMACRIYFCPSHRVLPQRFKIVARAAIDNWYTYGLIITECNLINACFKEIETRLGIRLNKKEISQKALWAIHRLLAIKMDWPFRNPEWPVGNYFFDDQKYCPPQIDYQKTGYRPSRYHEIFYALGSVFSCRQSMQRAEEILNAHFVDITDAILEL